MIHIVKGFRVINRTEVAVFLEFTCFLYDPVNAGNLTSGSSVVFKANLNILAHLMLTPNLEDFEHSLSRMGDECNCPVV